MSTLRTDHTVPTEADYANGRQLAAAVERMKAIAAAAGDRPLTKSQAADFETLQAQAAALRRALGEPVTILDGSDVGTDVVKSAIAEHEAYFAEFDQRAMARGRKLYAASFGQGTADGDAPVAYLRPDQKLAARVDGFAPAVGLGSFLKGIVTGDWRGVPAEAKSLEAKSLAVGVGSAGGYIVPDALSASIIDKARNASVVLRAGALTVPMESSELHIARLAGDAGPGWKAENAAATASDLTFERVTLRARTLVALVKASVELFEDAADIAGTVERSLAAALALELDRAALRGAGGSEPTGILNATGVSVTGSIGSPSSYVAFADTPTRTLREANAAEPFSFISSPRTFTSLESLVTGIASDKTRLAPPPAWDAFGRYATNQVPINLGAGTNESEAYIGDFRQLLVGMRTNLVIEASREAADATNSAFGSLQVWIRAYLRADVALAHPEHFAVLTGILA